MRSSVIFAAAILVAVAMCTAVSAAPAPPSTDGWTLTPVVDGTSVSLILGIDNASALSGYGGTATKTWGDPTLSDPSKFIVLGDSGGVLRYLTLSLDGDPEFALEFDYEAGSAGNDVVIEKPVLSFATINQPTATATAAVTVTDTDGDGATATGAYQRGAFYDARYNTLSTAGDFAFLVGGPITASPYLSCTGSQTTSPLWQPIGVPVSDMRSYFGFHLTPNDTASGTSNFKIVPEPSSLVAMLTGFVSLAGFLKRRRP